MALTGTLKDFGIAEILQLIGMQKKTGVLTLEDDHHRAEIDFSDGMVVGARGGTDKVSLEKRLVKSGLLSPEQYAAATRRVKETLKPFCAVILAEGMISLEVLRGTIALHISEIVFGTFSWKSGTYAFEQKFLQWDKQLVTPMSAESIMMDGLRIVDETPSVGRFVPSMDVIFKHSSRIDPSSIELSGKDKVIFNMLDGNATVRDLVYRLRQPRFEVMKQLAHLRQSGFIEPSEGERSAPRPAIAPARINRITQASVYVLLAVMLMVAVMRLGGAVLNFARPFNPQNNGGSVPALLKAAQASRIRNALEVYRLQYGAYPESLQMLVEKGILKSSDLVHPVYNDDASYGYSSDGASYSFDMAAFSAKGAPTVAEDGR